ncbi:unnamed protein product [Mytilus coruscus]|uniref:Uncharacterized protein n=1 Tax=Mytilus coruscus TaxID=42192 RepID=A0A6J8CR54_MYTCO|nr:unnamed protein product [Mytilus coruscus]
MASIFDDLPKIAVESVTQSNLWMPDTEFIKYKLPDQPKPPTGIAIKALFEKRDHDLYRPAARMVAFRVESKYRFLLWIKTFAFRYHSQCGAPDNYTCKWTDKENTKEGNIGLKDDNPTDNNNYDSKMSELNQNLDDLKGNQQKLEKELHGLVLSSNQMKKQFVSSAVLDKKLVDFEKSILTKINLQRNEVTYTVTLKENSDLKKALTNLESSNSKLRTQNEAFEEQNQFLNKKLSDLEKQLHEIHVPEIEYEATISTHN